MANAAQSFKIKPPTHPNLSPNTTDPETDRISELPESLLLHILSFLTTKEAARTCVLSQQWRFLWTRVPLLHIDNSCYRGMSAHQFDCNIMLPRRGRRIRKFTLDCDYNSDDFNIGSILNIVEFCSPKELTLTLHGPHGGHHRLFELRRGFLSCKTVVVLNLVGQIDVAVGSSVQFPCLKVLGLKSVTLSKENSFRGLFTGSPVLEDVFIDDCSLNAALRYQISSVSLNRLRFRSAPECYDYYSHSDDFSPPTITVNVPALEHLCVDYKGAPFVLVLQNMHNLVEAKFRMDYSRFDSTAPGIDLITMKNIFHAVSNVGFLEMQFDFDLPLDIEYPVSRPHIFPKFDNLVQLVMNAHCCLWPSVVKLLHCCSRLQHFTLHLVHQYFGKSKKLQCWLPLEDVPNCLSSHLTTCKLSNFNGMEADMEIAHYLLKNSAFLRKMTITYSPYQTDQMFRVQQNLCEFEKSSERCQLSFEDRRGDLD